MNTYALLATKCSELENQLIKKSIEIDYLNESISKLKKEKEFIKSNSDTYYNSCKDWKERHDFLERLIFSSLSQDRNEVIKKLDIYSKVSKY
jgi:septal ring factor EnvC (AmiA/AmiB activator)